ncbi:MAG TPA: hypothetical protein VK826_16115 [Bacteroidia bacterium]|nr:hypothetical protein [Bacteroidia bacterium]
MKKLLPVALALFVLASCGTDEDPFARETKEIEEHLSSEGLNAYKAFKVSVRGTKTVGEDTVFDKARMELFALTGYLLQKAADTTQTIDVMDIASTVSDAKPAIEVLLKKDEDSLPTVMQNISFVIQPEPGEDILGNMFNESEEHLILCGLWYAGAHAQPDLALYELYRVKTGDIRDVHLQMITEMARSVIYLSNKWPYHSEKSADDLLALTESKKDELLKNPWPATNAQGNAVTPEQAWHQLRAIAFLLRGAAREKTEDKDKHEEAISDLGEFVKEAEAGGLDHEIVDLAGLAVALEKEDNDAALKCIEKLEKRPNLTTEEKELVAEIKKYVTDKKMDDAQEAMDENGVLPGFAGKLFANQFMNSPVVKNLKSSKAGQKFISITEVSVGSLIPGADAVDSLTKDAESLIDKVIH